MKQSKMIHKPTLSEITSRWRMCTGCGGGGSEGPCPEFRPRGGDWPSLPLPWRSSGGCRCWSGRIPAITTPGIKHKAKHCITETTRDMSRWSEAECCDLARCFQEEAGGDGIWGNTGYVQGSAPSGKSHRTSLMNQKKKDWKTCLNQSPD